LHQYNQIGDLEDELKADEALPDEEARMAALAMALEGKHYPKRKQIPFMKITLSHCEIPELVTNGATYQPPQIRKLSKGAKNRAKKRKRKADAAEAGDDNGSDDESE